MSTTTPSRYHPLQVTLHWLIVLLVFSEFVIGKSMSRLPNDAAKILPLTIHMSLGITTLVSMLARVMGRKNLPRPAHATTGNAFLDWIGRLTHNLLYMLVLLMTVSGLSLSLRAGLFPIVFGGTGTLNDMDFHQFAARAMHGFIAPVLLGLIVLHILAAVYHQGWLKDNLLSRMWYGK